MFYSEKWSLKGKLRIGKVGISKQGSTDESVTDVPPKARDPEPIDKILELVRQRLATRQESLIALETDNSAFLPSAFLEVATQRSIAVCRIARYFSLDSFKAEVEELIDNAKTTAEYIAEKLETSASDINNLPADKKRQYLIKYLKEQLSIPEEVAREIFRDDPNQPPEEDTKIEELLKKLLEQLKGTSARQLSKFNPIAIGTGFLVGGSHLMTNHHVVSSAEEARECVAQFNYVQDALGGAETILEYEFDPDLLFVSNPQLDYTLVQLKSGLLKKQPGYTLGWIQLIEDDQNVLPAIDSETIEKWRSRNPDLQNPFQNSNLNPQNKIKGLAGDRVFILQHPRGERQKVVLSDNRVLRYSEPGFIGGLLKNYIRYTTPTDYGSSGAPVLNREGKLIALNHAVIHSQATSSTSERNFNFVYQGVRICRIVEDLKKQSIYNSKLLSFIQDFVLTVEQINYPPIPAALELSQQNSQAYLDGTIAFASVVNDNQGPIIKVWGRGKKTELEIFKIGELSEHITFSYDARFMAFLDPITSSVNVWNPNDNPTLKSLKFSEEASVSYNICYVGFTPDSKILGIVLGGGDVKLWNFQEDTVIEDNIFSNSNSNNSDDIFKISDAHFIDDNNLAIVQYRLTPGDFGKSDFQLSIWSIEDGKSINKKSDTHIYNPTLSSERLEVKTCFNVNGKSCAFFSSSLENGGIYIWSFEHGNCRLESDFSWKSSIPKEVSNKLNVVISDQNEYRKPIFLNNGINKFLSWENKGSIMLVDIADDFRTWKLDEIDSSIQSAKIDLRFTQDGKYLAFAYGKDSQPDPIDLYLKMWSIDDIKSGENIKKLVEIEYPNAGVNSEGRARKRPYQSQDPSLKIILNPQFDLYEHIQYLNSPNQGNDETASSCSIEFWISPQITEEWDWAPVISTQTYDADGKGCSLQVRKVQEQIQLGFFLEEKYSRSLRERCDFLVGRFDNNEALLPFVYLPYGEFSHVAITYTVAITDTNDDRSYKIYVNGVFKEETNKSLNLTPLFDPDTPVKLCDFMGSITELRFWEKARTSEEIRQDMYRRFKGDEPGLLRYWRLTETQGNIVLGYWRLTETQGNIVQRSGIVSGGRWLNTHQTASFPLVCGLQFTSSEEYVNCSINSLSDDTDEHSRVDALTVEAWTKHQFNNCSIVSQQWEQGGYCLAWHNGKIRVAFSDQTSSIKTIIDIKNQIPDLQLWHHVALTWDRDSAEVSVYLDGKLQDVVVLEGDSQSIYFEGKYKQIGLFRGTVHLLERNLQIGGYETDLVNTGEIPEEEHKASFGLVVSEVRLWNRVRTPEQIRMNLSRHLELSDNPASSVGELKGLVGLWRLGETDNSDTVQDLSGNKNDGKSHGNPTYFPVPNKPASWAVDDIPGH